jgi:hypothetical protein
LLVRREDLVRDSELRLIILILFCADFIAGCLKTELLVREVKPSRSFVVERERRSIPKKVKSYGGR